jgi:class 3 adenylate cyclase
LLTLLVTDIVDSTKRAVELGDGTWREMLARHYQDVRNVLDRHRGRQIKTTGDGILASFDGAGRAIQSAVAIRERAEQAGLEIRAAVHSGEVEVGTDDLAGVTVHEAARIAAVAGAGEVLVSETTRLLVGAGESRYRFEDRGGFDLKGLGWRRLYSVSSQTGAQ